MNQKKAKALRRAVAVVPGVLPKMTQVVQYPVYGWVENEVTRRREFKQTGVKPVKIAVNHYRNAKRLYRPGMVKQDAIRAARRHALELEACGVYKRVG